MNELVEKLKALGEINRLRIVLMLSNRPLCVCEMLSVLDISGATLSNHLKTLKHSGLVGSRRDGKWIEYHLEEGVEDYLTLLKKNSESEELILDDQLKLKTISRNSCSTALRSS